VIKIKYRIQEVKRKIIDGHIEKKYQIEKKFDSIMFRINCIFVLIIINILIINTVESFKLLNNKEIIYMTLANILITIFIIFIKLDNWIILKEVDSLKEAKNYIIEIKKELEDYETVEKKIIGDFNE